MINLGDLTLLLLVLLGGLYWWQAQGVRETALRATRLHCRREGLQLLDDTVALRGFWFKRDGKGRWHIWRGYQFEFTATGEERYQGRTITLGKEVERIVLPPHRFEPERDRLH